MHSTRSDGALAPEALLARCAQGNLDAVAITDHDLPPALPAGWHTVGTRRIRYIHGVELTGHHEGREYHLLAWFSGEMPGAFRDFCSQRARARAQRYDAALASMGLGGMAPADPAAHRGERALGRVHLAQALVESGHVSSVQQAFDVYLSRRHGHVPLAELSFVDAISAAVDAGAFTSWAHPGLLDARRLAGVFAEAGLHALEACRPGLGRLGRGELMSVAHRHRLGVTGGSDWHGWSGARLGEFSFPARLASPFLRHVDVRPS